MRCKSWCSATTGPTWPRSRTRSASASSRSWPRGTPPPPAPADGVRYRFAGWTLNAATRDLSGEGGRRAELTSSEFDLLVAFVQRPGLALSRDDLLRALRGRAWDYLDRSIDTLVARLRKKIDAPEGPSLLRSVRGVGYVLCAAVAHEDGGRN